MAKMAKNTQRLGVVLAGLATGWSFGCSAPPDTREEKIAALCAQTLGVEIDPLNNFEAGPTGGNAPFYGYDDNSLDRDNPDLPSTVLKRDLDFCSVPLAMDEKNVCASLADLGDPMKASDPATWDPLAFCATPGAPPPSAPNTPANYGALRFRGPISVLGSIDPTYTGPVGAAKGTGVQGFTNWGAGFSAAWSPGITALEDKMKLHQDNPNDPMFPAPADSEAPYTSIADDGGYPKDASGYEGIAFWARLGGEGEAQLQVGIHDVHTFRGSRINLVWPPLEGTTTIDGQIPFCYEPRYIDPDGTASDQTSYRKQCGDGFMRVLELTSQWRYYRIPFEELRQNGWGAVAPRLATEEIYSLFFGATPNQPVDILLDDIAFYRRVPSN